MSSSNEYYTFTFANGTVTVMTEIDGRKSKAQFIGNSDFDVITNAAGAVTAVTRTELSRKGYAETTVYSDADGDSRFHESLELEVATSAARNLDKMRFTFDANGDVLDDADVAAAADLPVVVGPGANRRMGDLNQLIDAAPALRPQITGAT